MSIYTPAEIEAEITIYKAALSALASARTTKINDKEITRHDIPSLREHLQWLAGQRDSLAVSGAASTPAAGRTYARNGGRG